MVLIKGTLSPDTIWDQKSSDRIFGDYEELIGARPDIARFDGTYSADWIWSERGPDRVYGDTKAIWGIFVGGDDVINTRENFWFVAGDAESIVHQGVGGNDTIGVTALPNTDIYAGDDPISGVVGDAAFLRDFSVGGDDTITYRAEHQSQFRTTLRGDAIEMMDKAHGGDDTIDDRESGGATFKNLLVGDADVMGFGTSGGDDVLYGSQTGQRFLVGDALEMDYFSTGGNDRLYGGDGIDYLFGDSYAPIFSQPLWPDYPISDVIPLWGGNDPINGGKGGDRLYGGSGIDIFEFDEAFSMRDIEGGKPAMERDVIYDFSLTEGDRISFTMESYALSYSLDVSSLNVVAGVLISVEDHGEVFLHGHELTPELSAYLDELKAEGEAAEQVEIAGWVGKGAQDGPKIALNDLLDGGGSVSNAKSSVPETSAFAAAPAIDLDMMLTTSAIFSEF